MLLSNLEVELLTQVIMLDALLLDRFLVFFVQSFQPSILSIHQAEVLIDVLELDALLLQEVLLLLELLLQSYLGVRKLFVESLCVEESPSELCDLLLIFEVLLLLELLQVFELQLSADHFAFEFLAVIFKDPAGYCILPDGFLLALVEITQEDLLTFVDGLTSRSVCLLL